MDWSGLKRAAHSNTGRERINLMEVAKDFLEGVEFAADVRGETSRRELVADWPTTQNVARPVNTSAFLGTNPTGELITSGSPVIRPQSSQIAPCRNLLRILRDLWTYEE